MNVNITDWNGYRQINFLVGGALDPQGNEKVWGEHSCWEECKKMVSFNRNYASDFHGNPLDFAEKIASTKILIFLVCDAVDRYVPYNENGELFLSVLSRQEEL